MPAKSFELPPVPLPVEIAVFVSLDAGKVMQVTGEPPRGDFIRGDVVFVIDRAGCEVRANTTALATRSSTLGCCGVGT
jgi:hypothetical protein